MGLNNLDDSKDGIEKFLKRNPDTCFAAEEDGKIVGVIMAGNDGRRGYITIRQSIRITGDWALRQNWLRE